MATVRPFQGVNRITSEPAANARHAVLCVGRKCRGILREASQDSVYRVFISKEAAKLDASLSGTKSASIAILHAIERAVTSINQQGS